MTQTLVLPSRPDLQQLRKQAGDLLRALRNGDAEALALLRHYHPAYSEATTKRPALADAQLVLARRYGFISWPRLKAHVEFVSLEFPRQVEQFVRAATAESSGGDDGAYRRAQEMLQQQPGDNFLQHALALEYVKAGDDASARSLFEEILTRDAGYIGSYYHLAQLLQRTGERDLAIEWYEKGMEAAKRAGDRKALGELRSAYEELVF